MSLVASAAPTARANPRIASRPSRFRLSSWETVTAPAEGHDRQHPERGEDGVVGRVMSVAEEVGLKDPRRDPADGRPASPSVSQELAKKRRGEREEKNRPQPCAGQILPGGSHKIPEQAEQGVERGMAVRLLAGEGPEIGQDDGVEEQLGPAVDLIGTEGARLPLAGQARRPGVATTAANAAGSRRARNQLRNRASRPRV